jgi:hypothetical protein
VKEILRVLAWLSLVGGLLIGIVLFATTYDMEQGLKLFHVTLFFGYVISGLVAFAVFGGMAEILERLQRLEGINR